MRAAFAVASVIAALGLLVAVGAGHATGRVAPLAPSCTPDPNDTDCDGVTNEADNCPNTRNPGQENTDAGYTPIEPAAADGSTKRMPEGDPDGDACDEDDDADGVHDRSGGTRLDNCRLIRNPDQIDTNDNRYGEDAEHRDLCAVDSDADGHFDEVDNCPTVPNPDQADRDGDGQGDVCDADEDGDGIPNFRDNCRTVPNEEQTDRDGDGVGTACDPEEAARPAPTPDGGGDGSASGARDTERPVLRLALARRQRASTVLGGMPTAVSCSEACGLTARVRLSARQARRARLPRALGTASGALGARGRTYLIFRIPRTASRRLRHLRRAATATVTVRAVDAAGNRSRASRRIRLVP